jgi:hypothetical protein
VCAIARRTPPDPDRIRFSPSILPPYMRRSKSIETLLPILYLKEISTGDFSGGGEAGGVEAVGEVGAAHGFDGKQRIGPDGGVAGDGARRATRAVNRGNPLTKFTFVVFPHEIRTAARRSTFRKGDARITDPSRKPTGGTARDNPCNWPLVACFQTHS